MARYREQPVAQKHRRRRPVQKNQGKHTRGVSKAKAQSTLRRSARLNPQHNEHTQNQRSLPANKTLRQQDRLAAPQSENRKRSRGVENPVDDTPTAPLRRRPRTGFAVKVPMDQEAPSCGRSTQIDPVDHWRREQTWPREYFEPDDTMSHLLARRKSTPSLRRKRSEPGSLTASSNTPSDQKPREEKSAPYQDARYEILLETKGSYMGRYVGEKEEGVTRESKDLCRTLLEAKQTVPEDSIFHDDFFGDTCEMIRNRNEAKVIQDIARLIVPSAQSLAIRGAKHLKCLIESINEGWNNSIPLLGPRPQPDYAVGFKRIAFTEDQLSKIKPALGDIMDMSFFMATYYMYFPFLACEVKCGAAALDVADRQNAHSMTLAVRAIVELFRLVKREKELHRSILAFSISHDHASVRIYGHYPMIKGKDTTFYRHPIRKFDFTELDGKEKWTAYKFTKNVYDIWMPKHLDRIRSAIDELPSDFDFEVPLLPESGLSQELESHHLSRSFTEPESLPGERDSRSGIVDQDSTPDTSFTERETPKRPRRNTGKYQALSVPSCAASSALVSLQRLSTPCDGRHQTTSGSPDGRRWRNVNPKLLSDMKGIIRIARDDLKELEGQ
ncbi:hypothetical protein BU26DRAFT_469083 [Trematosphaeria pertusa]|uniref:DUF7924 domain-containing protein n=1 Tax=Trematosphaeria pertusa TaxID=390896 RepID=A0A6A6HTC8_9PLEO|nr:uncharacterized protein BU26DRAFT_469083 [Trematosphaeria pertusa]KAF2241425.1 hypothetical protein BU26DRAFT_469083 [Trematosphaeria pertusa]